jgi:hypothetical protein
MTEGGWQYPTIRKQLKRRLMGANHVTRSYVQVVEGLLYVSVIEGKYLEVGITAEKLRS